MNESYFGTSYLSPKEVETPLGTPSPPIGASTVARPPPKPRRLPTINFIDYDDSYEGGTKKLSLVNFN